MADNEKPPTNIIQFPSKEKGGLSDIEQEMIDPITVENIVKDDLMSEIIGIESSKPTSVVAAVRDLAKFSDALDADVMGGPLLSSDFDFDHTWELNELKKPSEYLFKEITATYGGNTGPYSNINDMEDAFEFQADHSEFYKGRLDLYSEDKEAVLGWIEDIESLEESYKQSMENLHTVLQSQYPKEFVDFIMENPEGQKPLLDMVRTIVTDLPHTFGISLFKDFLSEPSWGTDQWRYRKGDPRPSLKRSDPIPDITGTQKFPEQQKRELLERQEEGLQEIQDNILPEYLDILNRNYKSFKKEEEINFPIDPSKDLATTDIFKSLRSALRKIGTPKAEVREAPKQIEGPSKSPVQMANIASALSRLKRATPLGAAAAMYQPSPAGEGSDIVPPYPLIRPQF